MAPQSRLWTAVTLSALLLAGCTRPQPGGPQAPGAPGGRVEPAPAPGAAVTWRPLADGDLPEAVRTWVEAHQGETGLFTRREGDALYVLVSWGERRTAGYEVRIEDVRACGDGVLSLAVHLRQPSPGEPVAQVITYPHAVAAVTPAADYRLAPVFLGSHLLQNEAFEVMEPMPYTPVAERVRVRGRARVFEATFMVRVEDAGGVLVERHAMTSQGAPAWGEFDVDLPLPRAPQGEEGRVVLYEASAKDGTPTYVLSIPVRFRR